MSVEILASTVEPANNPSSISDHCGRILCRSRGFSVAINRTLPALFSVLYNPRASHNSLSHGWAGVVHPRWGSLPGLHDQLSLFPRAELPPWTCPSPAASCSSACARRAPIRISRPPIPYRCRGGSITGAMRGLASGIGSAPTNSPVGLAMAPAVP